MSDEYTLIDPFTGETVTMRRALIDRLHGKYACGPILENGEPEFGYTQHDFTPPIQLEAAAEIAQLRQHNADLLGEMSEINRTLSPNPERTFDGLVDDSGFACDIARAAIAKATGQEAGS